MALWTNLLKQSADFSQTWATPAQWTEAEATSVLPGETARKFTGDGATGSLSVQQDADTLTGSPETVAWIVERVDTTATQIALRDQTVGDWVGRILLTWSTGATSVVSSGVGTITDHGSLDLETTPNSGTETRLVWMTATPDNAGNARGVWCYPINTPTSSESAILHYAGLFEASTYAPAYLVNGATIQEHRVVDLSDYKVSFRPRQTAEPLTHRRPRASGKMSTAVHSNAVRARTWSLETEIEDRATGEALQAELDAPGRIHVVHNPLIHPVTGVAVECEASNVRRLDGPQEDHVRLGFDLLEVRPL